MEDVKEILVKAKSLIENPENWYKGYYYNRETGDLDCMCSLGAITRAVAPNVSIPFHLKPKEQSLYMRVVRAVESKSPLTLYSYNDFPSTSHEDIMNLFDRVIEEVTV